MKYAKPEICIAVPALPMVKGRDKSNSMMQDSINPQWPALTAHAYEADE